MARRFREHAGLLRRTLCAAAALLALAAAAAAESGPEEALAVAVSSAPEEPAADGPFTLTLLVGHPSPAEVVVQAPAFPASFRLERTRVEPRLLPGSGGRDERWTAVEYAFRLTAPGEFRLGRFSVRAAEKRAATEELVVRVSGGEPLPAPASLRWEGVPAALRVGEAAELALVLSGAIAEAGTQAAVAVPENAVFRALPVPEADRRRGTVARFRLTPLESGAFRLPEASLRAGGAVLRAPSRTVPVSAAGAPAGKTAVPAAAAARRSVRAAAVPSAAFPEASPAVPRLLRPALDGVLGIARDSWNLGDRVSSLAVLRAAERDSSLGLLVRPVRKAAEAALGLAPGRDEPFAPFTALAALLAVSLAAALGGALSLLPGLLKGRGVTSSARRRFTLVGVAAALALLSAGRLLYAGSRAGESVVLSDCSSLRVPDPASARSAAFSAGQSARVAVRAADEAGEWLFVEAEDGRSGWVRSADARRY